MGQILGSVGQDLKLKIWHEDESQATCSGHRFRNIFTQSAAHQVIYVCLDFKNIHHETLLAVITRDGLLSLLEPVRPDVFDDWKEIDQFWVSGGRMPRGGETSFKVCFQQSPFPNYQAVIAGVQANALSLVAAAMDIVKVYRLSKPEDASYHFQAPVAELTGVRGGLVRDVAWAPAAWIAHDLIATAWNDDHIRIYELSVLRKATPENLSIPVRAPVNLSAPANASMATYHRIPSGIGAGLAGAHRDLSDVGNDIGIGHLPHDWKLAAEIRSKGVWKVEWVSGRFYGHTFSLPLIITNVPIGTTLISAGDDGQVHVWRRAKDAKWKEFAEFGREKSELEFRHSLGD